LRHRVLADNARDVLWNMSPEGAFTFISPSVEMVRGYTAAEALRQTMEQCLTPASHAVWHSEFAKLHADWQHGEAPQSVRVELEYLCKDGSTLWSEVMAHPLFSDKGLAEIVGVTRDIAEHKRMLQQLQEAHDATEQANQALVRANAELARRATTDPLTGIWNRRHFVEVADSRREQARRYQEPLSMLMFDIDHFKRINDSWGHPTGDRVLMELATLVGNSLRQGDAFARWGGEEFVLITAHIGAADAMLLAEKLRDRVASHGFAEVGTVTISLGVAEFALEESLDAWFKRVDLALYAAKSDGRNLARLAPPKLAEALRCEAALLAG
jgi:diguanylate cyclase (GGDEF)-like protein/PAS domain S-box-containing protein